MTPDLQLPRVAVPGGEMAWRECGPKDAPQILFLHGNPTSSFIWRNIMARVGARARCIAPDLIGFGQSSKPPIDYRFADHASYLDAFLDALDLRPAVVVAQDWGTALAFDLAARRPAFVQALAFMEFIRPMPGWNDFHQSEQARALFRKFRTPGEGETLILDGNVFVEKVLPGSILRSLSDDEMAVYRAPFSTRESRLPTWRLPNELPIAGEPADVWARLSHAHEALASSTYPKILFYGDPGALVSPGFALSFAAGLRNCRAIALGAGKHYLQEDHPDAIAQGVLSLLEFTRAA